MPFAEMRANGARVSPDEDQRDYGDDDRERGTRELNPLWNAEEPTDDPLDRRDVARRREDRHRVAGRTHVDMQSLGRL